MVDHSLEAVRRLSVHSIKSVVHCSATQQIVMIVSHVGPDHVVAAFDYGLKDVWQCRSEALRAIANEKQTKVISQETFDYPCSDKDKQSARPEYIVTAMCADEANKSILLAVKGGTLLRIAYERKKLNTDTDDSDPTLSQFKCDIFISWALDIQPARTTEFKDLASKKKANAQPINITSVCCFVNSTTNVSGLLIACDDGSVRHHSVSVTGLPEYVGKSLKRSEQEEGIGSMRGDAAYPIIVNAGTDMQFIMIFCNGMLYIYDIAEVEPMVELGILLDRSSKLSSDVKTRRLRRMSILHEKKGWIVLIAGKGWSIVNIEGLFGWRNIMKMEYKSPKSRKGQRSRASAKHIGQQDSVATQEGTEGGETVSALDSESGSSSEEDSETGDDTASVIPGDGEDVSKE
ncbi:uncharacterized protein BJ171DRAFT_509593 [Polychytrium aggregatum]|uniref:uncharacterized protein n=1 Tax=Polychytrium aggregatum TaxID=110093 RepID=UPI0022FF0DEB|nr:uncharacterized protein BJ171DRAFT_509593 [Polychytrium aggregatum]KAI9203404.1 hypothetical protein BJ171DRAFT_509593 [Polychytrium aggregatum]